ncbi:hypothetical protein GCM10011506_20670 [Marivirga lumbricoides]|uniref:histidine kinase n=1 Tax=Marivirga lumbricoides TaxID=1046115 RepID=A0ABQ1M5T1_9BACT|nr:hypothetical protein GCM10011506_20670 [Marivirga lumbricoides]
MLKYLKIYNWSAIDKTLEQKPNIFLSQFSVIAVLACVIQIINDAIYTNIIAVILDVSVLLVFSLAYLLNERRCHMAAKLVFCGIGTGLIFIYAAIVPKETAVYLLFFPIATIIFLIFSNEQRIYKYGVLTYVILLLLILELTDYQPLGDLNVTEGISLETSYYVNLAIALFVLIFSMYNIDLINIQIEKVRLAAERELLEKNLDLKQANEELDHFVYSASHDLKAPLLSILGLINIAKYDIKDENTLEYFVRIEDRVQRLSKFIKEVIEISRNTRTQVEKVEVDLDLLICDIIENNSFKDISADVKIEKNIELNEKVLIDRPRLEVILNNLVSNAIKYQVQDHPNPKIEIEAKLKDEILQIIVSDNGIGISHEHHDKIFEMFYRGEQSKEGSGLGLYIVKNMVEKLEGELKLASKVGEGTTITLLIPMT